MATKILVRRGLVEDLDEETLDEGELAFTTDELGLYVGSDKTGLPGHIKVNATDFIEYDGNALTSATDTNNLKEAVQNIDAALKTEQDNVDTLQTDLDTLESDVETLTTNFDEHTHGTINNDGTVTAASVTPATGDELVVVDADDNNLKKAIAIDANGTGYLKEDGTWSMPNVGDLANAVLTNVQNGQILKYENGDWVNSSVLDDKAPKANPTFTGTVTLPNTGNGLNEAATKSYVDTKINDTVFGDVPVEWQLEGEQNGEILPSGFNVFIDGITWDFENYDYKVVFDFETTAEDNDQPYMRFNGLSNTATGYNYLYKRTSSVDDSVTVVSAENTSLIYFGAQLPTGSTVVGQTQYQGEFIIRRSVNGSPTGGTPIHNYSVRGFSSVTAATAPASGFTGYPVEATFVGNFNSASSFTSIDIYSGISAGATDYAKARIYKRAK